MKAFAFLRQFWRRAVSIICTAPFLAAGGLVALAVFAFLGSISLIWIPLAAVIALAAWAIRSLGLRG